MVDQFGGKVWLALVCDAAGQIFFGQIIDADGWDDGAVFVTGSFDGFAHVK